MKKIVNSLFILVAAFLMTACQKDKFEPAAMLVEQPDMAQFKGNLEGFKYTITWNAPAKGYYMMYSVYQAGSQILGETVDKDCLCTLTIDRELETGDEYEVVFKYCTTPDGSGPLSKGTVITYTRPGALKVKDLIVSQIEEETSLGVKNTTRITWNPSPNAAHYDVKVDVYSKKGEFKRNAFTGKVDAKQTELNFESEYDERWIVEIISVNNDGISTTAKAERLIGKTKNAFLSLYPTEDALLSQGDDDEICAWKLLHKLYPDMRYLYLGTLTAEDLDPLRMCFFIRDVESGRNEDVYAMPAPALAAAPVIGEWVKKGGNLCLWSHAVVYIGTIGRFPADQFAGGPDAIDCGPGGINNDLWKMAATTKTNKFTIDHLDHPLFRGLRTEKRGDGVSLVPCKGAGWTENHNCCFYDRPTWWTELPNNEKACYEKLVDEFGVTPLGTWDNEQVGFVSQFNVWEAGPAKNPNPKFEGNSYEGTILCIANGGFEISMRNNDGTPNLNIEDPNNSEQDNINKAVLNAVEYLMSK